MHAVGVPVPAVFCDLDLPARKEQEKARKGKDILQGREREQRQRQTKSKGTDSLHPTLRTSRDGAKHDVAHRKAKTRNQPDRERKARSTSTNEAKHDVVEAKHDVVEAKHGVIKAKHGVRSKARRLSCLNLRKAFFSSLRRSRRRGRGRATGQQCVREPGDCARNPGAMPPKKPPWPATTKLPPTGGAPVSPADG